MRLSGSSARCRCVPCLLILFLLFGGAVEKTDGSEGGATGQEEFSTAQEGGQGSGVERAPGPKSATDKRDLVIDELLQRVEKLELKLRSLTGEPEKALPPAAASAPAPPAKAEEEESIARAALERTLIERSGILLAPGTLEIEPSLTYAHASADNISIDGVSVESTLVIGEIVSDKIRRNILIPALAFRVGLPADFQAEAKFPLRYEANRTVRGDSTEDSGEAYGLGDIELALSHQLMREKGWSPDMLGSLRWKTNTGRSPAGLITNEQALGTGYHALSFMLTALKVKEPAAFFGSLLYTLNLPVAKEEGRFSPGDTWGFNLGLALALNLDTSINFVWEQRFGDTAELNGKKLLGSALYPGNLRIGATYFFSPKFSLDVSVVIGLTRDAPDVQAVVAVPIRFPRFFSLGSE